LLPRYLIKGAPELHSQSLFEWRSDGFYAELSKRVREHFNGSSHKATPGYWLRLTLLLTIYGSLWYAAHIRGSAIAAMFAGATWMVLLFYGILHDASHQALSSHAFVNKFWSVLTNHWYVCVYCYGSK